MPKFEIGSVEDWVDWANEAFAKMTLRELRMFELLLRHEINHKEHIASEMFRVGLAPPPPYPMCRNRNKTPNPCVGKGYCPMDPACND